MGVSQIKHNIARTYLPDQLLGEKYNEITKNLNLSPFLYVSQSVRSSSHISIIFFTNSNAVIHTSYITNEHTMTYQDRDYGLIYGLNSENLLFMSAAILTISILIFLLIFLILLYQIL